MSSRARAPSFKGADRARSDHRRRRPLVVVPDIRLKWNDSCPNSSGHHLVRVADARAARVTHRRGYGRTPRGRGRDRAVHRPISSAARHEREALWQSIHSRLFHFHPQHGERDRIALWDLAANRSIYRCTSCSARNARAARHTRRVSPNLGRCAATRPKRPRRAACRIQAAHLECGRDIESCARCETRPVAISR